jgi:hypothetical protein
MIRKTSIKNCTTDSSSIYKKKEENNSSTSTPLTHVSLVNKSGILNEVLNIPKDSVSGSGAFLALSNTDEMSEISTSDKSVVTHGRTHADGMRQHVQQSNKAGKVVIVDGVETMQHTLFGGRKN